MPDPKKILPKQKTFEFKEGIKAEKIDEEVNAWIKEQASNNTPVHLGKCFSNHKTGSTFYVFMYSITL